MRRVIGLKKKGAGFMNDDLKFILGVVLILLVVGIVFVGAVGALMYLDAYIKISMPAP